MANPLKKTTQTPRNDEQKRLIRDQFMDEISEAIAVLQTKRQDATYRQLAMSINSYVGNVQLLDGLPKGIQEVAPALNEIMECVEKLGWSRTKFFDELLEEVRLEVARQRLSGSEAQVQPSQPPHERSGSELDSRRPSQADRAAQGASAAGDAP